VQRCTHQIYQTNEITMNIEVNFNINITTDASNLTKIQKLVEEIKNFSVSNNPTTVVPEVQPSTHINYVGMDVIKQINIVNSNSTAIVLLVEMCEQYLNHEYNFDGHNHMVQSICSQFRSKGYLSDKQENALRVSLSCLLNHIHEFDNYYAKDAIVDN
jgi:hypothetical protein